LKAKIKDSVLYVVFIFFEHRCVFLLLLLLFLGVMEKNNEGGYENKIEYAEYNADKKLVYGNI
jgi:hypothetical protein